MAGLRLLLGQIQSVRARGITKIHAYVLVPKSYMQFMFSTVYRVTQKYYYARPYTSMWAPVVVRQISKRYLKDRTCLSTCDVL